MAPAFEHSCHEAEHKQSKTTNFVFDDVLCNGRHSDIFHCFFSSLRVWVTKFVTSSSPTYGEWECQART